MAKKARKTALNQPAARSTKRAVKPPPRKKEPLEKLKGPARNAPKRVRKRA